MGWGEDVKARMAKKRAAGTPAKKPFSFAGMGKAIVDAKAGKNLADTIKRTAGGSIPERRTDNQSTPASRSTEIPDVELSPIPDVGQPFNDLQLPEVDVNAINSAMDAVGDSVSGVNLPDVAANYANIPHPADLTGQISEYWSDAATAGSGIQGPDYQGIYGQVDAPENLGGQMAGYYSGLGYQEDTENINRLYDDMMKLYDWGEVKDEVLREGAIGSRAATGLNAGPGLGGSFISAMGQADINTQGALMAKKMDFLNRLTDIQQQRAQALATEHQLGQKYGIEIGEIQAGIKADEDKAIRDAQYELEVEAARSEAGFETSKAGQMITGEQQAAQQEAAALTDRAEAVDAAERDLGIKVADAKSQMQATQYAALINAAATKDAAKMNAIAQALSAELGIKADVLIQQAQARSNIIGNKAQFDWETERRAAEAEEAKVDVSTDLGVNVMIDPDSGVGTFTGSDGKEYTVSATAVTTIQQAQLQMKMDEGVADVRAAVTEWAAKNPNATRQEILNKAGNLIYQDLINMMLNKDKRENRDNAGTSGRLAEITKWAKKHMADSYGETWNTNFTGIMKNEKYRPKAPTQPTVT